MKTYTLFAGILLGIFILGCSSPSESPTDDSITGTTAEYDILLSGVSGLYTKTISSESDGMFIGASANLFPGFPTPTLTDIAGSKISLYHRTNDCGGNLMLYDFQDDTQKAISMFLDLSPCAVTVTAVTQQGNNVFVSYFLELEGKEKAYYIRTLDLTTESVKDVELNKKPIQLVLSNDRLFVLTIDDEDSFENWISIMDVASNTFIHDMNVGSNAGKLFKKPNGDVIISYPDLHTTINSTSLKLLYTKYEAETEPDFLYTETVNFDITGKMYYQMFYTGETGTTSIPAVYDFQENRATLYFFKNFLNESQLTVEFNIEKATTVHYDEANGIMLIGYKKNGKSGGGIMRITPAPNLTFLDNIDLEDIPSHIFIR